MIETPHIKCKKEDIASVVLMPGDPLRAKFIAETYLENYKLVNSIRNMLAYTGFYKGRKITVFSSGMGIASMAIYCYELYNFFDVKTIIRIGSCGSNNPNIKVLDIILSTSSYTENNFSYTFDSEEIHEAKANYTLNSLIVKKAKEKNINLKLGKTMCTLVFDQYIKDKDSYNKRLPKDVIASEMEAFSLFYIANKFKKQASCLLTVSDSIYENKIISSEERQNNLKGMIELALETCLEVK